MKIIYEDRHMLVCEKDAGVPVQTASVRVKDLTDEVRAHVKGGDVWVVHRLDQPVRGLVVFALTQKAAAVLSKQAGGAAAAVPGRRENAPSMEKTYLALVRCKRLPENETAGKTLPGGEEDRRVHRLENWLLRDPKTNRSGVVSGGTKGAKRAVLEYTEAGRWLPDGGRWIADPASVCDPEAFEAAGRIFAEELKQEEPCVLRAALQKGTSGLPRDGKECLAALRIRLLTGRHHQIRVQLAAAGMPILGDRKYGDSGSESGESGKREPAFPALCAWRLTLAHPADLRAMEFTFQERTGESET